MGREILMYANNDNYSNLYEMDAITNEIPIGWSAACLDQTVFYYIDCNYIENEEKEHQDLLNTES